MLEDTLIGPFLGLASQFVAPSERSCAMLATEIVMSLEIFANVTALV
jgi:hypothetical protein